MQKNPSIVTCLEFYQRRLLMNTFLTISFLYTPNAWMFQNQKPNQYINRTQKLLLRIVNKNHESSVSGILAIQQQLLFLLKFSEIFSRTAAGTEEYIFRNFKMYV